MLAALWTAFTAACATPVSEPADPSRNVTPLAALDPQELLRHAERDIADQAFQRCRARAARIRHMQYVGADVDARLALADCRQRWCSLNHDAALEKGGLPPGPACTHTW